MAEIELDEIKAQVERLIAAILTVAAVVGAQEDSQVIRRYDQMRDDLSRRLHS